LAMKREQIIQTGSVAVVTGASSGIGKEIAWELARLGLHVYALARSLPDFFQDAAQHQVHGAGFIRPVKIDVKNEPALSAALNKIIQTESRLDCLVQAAGFGLAGSVEDTASSESHRQMEINFFGSTLALKPVLRQMRSQRRGLIVQIGSVAGALPIPFQAYYSASKAALAALTLSLGNEVRPWGIRCMLVQPGDTRTGFTGARVMADASSQSDYQEVCRRSVGRMEKDESDGMDPAIVARGIVRRMSHWRPPLVYTPGLYNKLVVHLARLLPIRLVSWVISIMYAR
jgi:short-subunit dehydrogenase